MKTRKERFTEWTLAGVSTLSILSMGGIVLFLLLDGIPFFKFYPLTDFLFGLGWYPTDDPMEFGILPLIVGSLTVMALATVIAVPLGVATAIYLSEVARPGMRRIVKPFVELLAALPSVVIGFFGMVVVAPFLQDYLGASTGLNLLNAGLMLAFMSVPIICSVAEDAIYSVPRELREASLSLGATKWETLTRVVLPAASSGIGTAVMLGMSRSIGETMVVLMVAGGAAVIPTSLFDSVRPIPASIAAEMAEAPFHSEHYYALFATGIVLIIFTLIFNATAFRIAEKKNSGIGC
ncbi:phosphate ABC transporter permease subunit PstC [Mailhella sp.]|uniref:phosphate ABC transporter permease subunit PstC n=1 Tax=Mailhella sp. TaxID=1981029 RepID=UPI003AB867C3